MPGGGRVERDVEVQRFLDTSTHHAELSIGFLTGTALRFERMNGLSKAGTASVDHFTTTSLTHHMKRIS